MKNTGEVQSKRVDWFNGISQDDKALVPARSILSDRDQWMSNSVTSIEKPDQSFVKAARNSRALYQTDKESLVARIEELEEADPEDRLDLKAMRKLRLSNDEAQRWKKTRREGARKIGKGLQSFLCRFSDFLEAYSGIVEMMKGADQQYGGLAYGTLSLLLSVSVHKQQREEAISEALDELNHAFPRLQILEEITPKPKLHSLVAEIYSLVISFARETTEYFQRSSLGRVKDALLPQKLKFETIGRIRKQLLELHRESEIQMQERIWRMEIDMKRMRKSLDEMNQQLTSTKKSVEAGRSAEKIAYLSKLRKLLNIATPYRDPLPHTDTATYRTWLTKAFQQQETKYGAPCAMTRDLLEKEDKVHEWFACEHSCLLVLAGKNWLDSQWSTMSWLSQASLIAIERLQNEQQHVAYFYCQTTWTVTERTKCAVEEVFFSLIYQIATFHPDFLQSRLDAIRGAVASFKWPKIENADDPISAAKLLGEAFEAMAELLIVLLSDFEAQENITIVIDRLDKCRWYDEEGYEGFNMQYAIDCLIRVASESNCRVKVLVVVDSQTAKRLPGPDKDLLKAIKHRFVQKLDWHQEVASEQYMMGPLVRRNSAPTVQ